MGRVSVKELLWWVVSYHGCRTKGKKININTKQQVKAKGAEGEGNSKGEEQERCGWTIRSTERRRYACKGGGGGWRWGKGKRGVGGETGLTVCVHQRRIVPLAHDATVAVVTWPRVSTQQSALRQ